MTNLPRLAGLLHHLPDARDLRLVDADGLPSALHPAAAEVYAAVPELVDLAAKMSATADAGRLALSQCYATLAGREDDIRLALRLTPDTPWATVLAQARAMAERDPQRTLDGEVGDG